MISMASEADISIQSTPTHSSRTFKADDNNSDRTSPGSFDSCSIASKLSMEAVPRSRSTDFLEKPGAKTLLVPGASSPSGSPVGGDESITSTTTDGQKSPVQRVGVSVGSNVLAEMKAKQEKRSSGIFTNSTATSISSNSNVSGLLNKFKQTEEKESVTVTHAKSESKSISSVNVNINSVTSTVSSSGSSVKVNSTSESSSVSVSKAKEQISGNKNSLVANAAAALNANASNNVNKRPPPVAPKPRPWSVVGSDRRSG